MRINRSLGLLMFLFVMQFLLTNAFVAFSSATASIFGTIEAAAILAHKHMDDF